MTPNEPQVADTARYSQREAARLLGIHPNTLRRYTESGKVGCGFHRTNGRPFYMGREIKRLWRSQV